MVELKKKKQEIPDKVIEYLEKGDHLAEISGVEDIFPLVIESDTILSYFNDTHKIFFVETFDLLAEKDHIAHIFNELYKKRSSDIFTLEPEMLLRMQAFD